MRPKTTACLSVSRHAAGPENASSLLTPHAAIVLRSDHVSTQREHCLEFQLGSKDKGSKAVKKPKGPKKPKAPKAPKVPKAPEA